jgi:hypothetical protein
MVGAATAPAAIIRPNNNALREAFIPYSFLVQRLSKRLATIIG